MLSWRKSKQVRVVSQETKIPPIKWTDDSVFITFCELLLSSLTTVVNDAAGRGMSLIKKYNDIKKCNDILTIMLQ